MTTGSVATVVPGLRPDWVDDYERDGFVVLRGAFPAEEVAAVNAEAVRLCRADYGTIWWDPDDPLGAGAENPATGGGGRDDTDDDLDDDEVLRRYLCLHFPHKASPLVRDTIAHPVLVDALTRVIGPDVKSMQSMLFLKSEGKPGQAWHQDELFIPTRDRSLTAAWIALDDARIDNGCLWALPGSHRAGVLYPTASTTTRATTAPSRPTTSRTGTRTRCPSRWTPGTSCSSTGTCCTSRCPTPPAAGPAAPWCTTT